MMLDFILPFRLSIDTVMIAGSCLWSLALYLCLASLREWIMEQLNRWFNFAEGLLYSSSEDFKKTRTARESLNAFYASVCSILPFLAIGGICNYGIEIGLGRSWALSMGILACMACGIYELGRQNAYESDEK